LLLKGFAIDDPYFPAAVRDQAHLLKLSGNIRYACSLYPERLGNLILRGREIICACRVRRAQQPTAQTLRCPVSRIARTDLLRLYAEPRFAGEKQPSHKSVTLSQVDQASGWNQVCRSRQPANNEVPVPLNSERYTGADESFCPDHSGADEIAVGRDRDR
jgi:hypothetical protein